MKACYSFKTLNENYVYLSLLNVKACKPVFAKCNVSKSVGRLTSDGTLFCCLFGQVDKVARRWLQFITTSRVSGPAMGSIPGAGTVNQAVHPSGIGELVGLQLVGSAWETAVQDCER